MSRRPSTPNRARAARAVALAAAVFALVAAVLVAPRATAAPCPATAGNCAVLLDGGTNGGRLDVVFLGDGYTAADEAKFYADASAISTALFAEAPYATYAPLFNAYALFTPSAESGADDPSENHLVDTAFDAAYDTNDIFYLLAVDDTKVYAEINARIPQCDLIVVLVNATPYGGSGGAIAVVSLDQASIEIARHEIGHTIANLADEYDDPYPGYPPGDDEPNVTAVHHLSPLKWSAWVTPGTPIPTPINLGTGDVAPVGAFEGADYLKENMFRPVPRCIMRELGKPFCPVCDEAMVLSFSELSSLIDLPVPAGAPSVAPLAATTTFSATLPELPNLTISWSIDGVDQGAPVPTFALQPAAEGLTVGPHTLALRVADGSPLVRNDPDGIMTETYTWYVAVTAIDCATSADGVACDDGDACTANDACASGVCVGEAPAPCAAPTLCQQAGTCDFLTGQCVYAPKFCAGPSGCNLASTCNEADGKCVKVPAPDGTACDDKSNCTTGDRCVAGKCTPTTTKTCPGADACHEAKCDKFFGLCSLEAVPDGDPCDDGNLCTMVDTCDAEVCVPESVVTCPAPDECHLEGACDPSSGACSEILADDGTVCSGGTCLAGVCTPTKPNQPAPEEDDGCGCRVIASRDAPRPLGAIPVLVALAAAMLRRRSTSLRSGR